MHYRAKLIAGKNEVQADGDSEEQAIFRALAEGGEVLTAATDDPLAVALVMFQVYAEGVLEVTYAMTLGRYWMSTRG